MGSPPPEAGGDGAGAVPPLDAGSSATDVDPGFGVAARELSLLWFEPGLPAPLDKELVGLLVVPNPLEFEGMPVPI